MSNILVHGIGVNNKSRPTWCNGKQIKIYGVWKNMIERCYSEKVHEKYPTYKNCFVSENFKHYEYFYDWYVAQIGFNLNGYHLDKDILTKGNKEYSENTCVLVPQNINQFLTIRKSERGDLPLGVSYSKTRKLFHARLNNGDGKLLHIGYFNTSDEAFNAYKIEKEKLAKEIAEKYKGLIDERVYLALINLTINIED